MRTILITGGNRGLGFELAAQLLESGLEIHLILTCRNQQSFDTVKGKLTQRLGRSDLPLSFIALDLLHKESVEQAIDHIKNKNISIDVLVNNAAVLYRMAFATVGQETITINFLNTKLFTDQLLNNDCLSEGFRVIIVSAILGNIKIVHGDQLKTALIEVKPDDINNLAHEWIKMIDQQQLTDKIVNKQLALASEYAISKLLLNIYTRQFKDYEKTVQKNGAAVAVHPGHIKTDMGTEYAPLEIGEGVKPMLDLIKMTDDMFRDNNGKFMNRHLKVLNVLDNTVDFNEHIN